MNNLSLINFLFVLYYGIALSLIFAGIEFWKKGKQLVITLIFFGILQAILYITFGENQLYRLYPLGIHLPLIIILWRCYKKPLLISLIAVTSAYLLCTPRKWIGTIVSMLWDNSQAVSNGVQILVTIPLLIAITKWVAPHVVRLKHETDTTLKFIALVPTLYYVIEYWLTVYTDLLYTGGSVIVEFMDAVIAILYFVFTVMHLNMLEKRNQAQNENMFHQMMEKNYRNEFAILKKSQETTTMHRHDLRQHIRLINSYLDEGNETALKEYIKIYGQKLSFADRRRFCQNHVANTMVRYYIERAEHIGIDVSCDMDFPEDISISEPDICVLLGNILENAIDALEGVGLEKSPQITIKSRLVGSRNFVIEVKNSPVSEPIVENGKYISTKDKGSGIGTTSIASIANYYGGQVNMEWKDKTFTSSIALPIQEN
ncbi:MAG: ATP-binding protein [Anaerovoracaceae bacterium]